LSSVSLFLLKEINIHTISVLIYHGMRMGTRAAGAMPRRQTHMRVGDARVSVLYILAHTVLRLPLPILIPPTATHSSSIIRGGYNKPISCL
jgi:hypothetical protein